VSASKARKEKTRLFHRGWRDSLSGFAAATVLLVLLGVCVLGLLVFLWVRKNVAPQGPFARPAARLLAKGPLNRDSPESWNWQVAAVERLEPQERPFFWSLRQQESPLPPLRLALFLRGRYPKLEGESGFSARKLDFVASLAESRPDRLSAPTASLLAELASRAEPSLQARILGLLGSSPLRAESVTVLIDQLKARKIAPLAVPNALLAIAVHAEPKHTSALKELREALSGSEREVIGRILQLLSGGDPSGVRGRKAALSAGDPQTAGAALRYFSLHGPGPAAEELERFVRDEKVERNERYLAMAALSLGRRITSVKQVLDAALEGDCRMRADAVRALHRGLGAPLPYPGPLDSALGDQGPLAERLKDLLSKLPGNLVTYVIEKARAEGGRFLEALRLRAEAGQLRTASARQELREALRSYASLTHRARPFFAYAAAWSLSPGDAPLFFAAIRAEEVRENRIHLLWALREISSGSAEKKLAELLLQTDPDSELSSETAFCLRCGILGTSERAGLDDIVALFPRPRSLATEDRMRWRLALILRYFPCKRARRYLLELAADPAARVRQAALFTLAELTGKNRAEIPALLSSAEAARLAKSWLDSLEKP